MSESNLKDLRAALTRSRWRIVAEHEGNDYDISGSWELHRDREDEAFYVDFKGLDDLEVLPIAKSYACDLRSNPTVSLYFRRTGVGGGKRRQLWLRELDAFVERLDEIARTPLSQRVSEDISEAVNELATVASRRSSIAQMRRAIIAVVHQVTRVSSAIAEGKVSASAAWSRYIDHGERLRSAATRSHTPAAARAAAVEFLRATGFEPK
jgi:predicted transcriptional regulator